MLHTTRSISRFPSLFASFAKSHAALKVCLVLCIAIFVIAYFGKSVISQQTMPNPTADALPQMNIIGTHKVDAEEYARQIKSRYASDSAEYREAETRYTTAMTAFTVLLDGIEQGVKADADIKNAKEFKDLAQTAIDASGQFHSFAENTLHLQSASATYGTKTAGVDAAIDASSKLQKAYGKKADKDKQYLAKDMRSLAKWKPWSEVAPTSTVSSAPVPAPSATPPSLRSSPAPASSPQPAATPHSNNLPG